MSQLVEINQSNGRRSLTITAASLQNRRIAPMLLQQLDERIQEAADDGDSVPFDSVKVDFARMDRIASEGIAGLMRINRYAHRLDVPLVVCNVADRIREVLRITRVERVVRFENECDSVFAGLIQQS